LDRSPPAIIGIEPHLMRTTETPGFTRLHASRMAHSNAVKIACLLRCADAIQIDQRRASAFPFAIHAPQGESLLHWQAQQLAQPVVQPDPDLSGQGALYVHVSKRLHRRQGGRVVGRTRSHQGRQRGAASCYQLMKDMGLHAFTV